MLYQKQSDFKQIRLVTVEPQYVKGQGAGIYSHYNKVLIIMRYFSRNFYIIRVDNVAHYTRDFIVRGLIILMFHCSSK